MEKRFSPALFLLFIALILILTACGDSADAIPNASRIQDDLGAHAASPIPASQTIDRIEIIDSSTDDDTGIHEALARVFSHDHEVAYIKFMQVRYQRNADDAWILASVSEDHSNPWITSPLAGANDSLVRESLIGVTLVIDDEDWQIDDNTFGSLTIESRDTDLENNTDVVIASVELSSDVLAAEGQMRIEFAFNDGWQVRDYRVYTPFTTSVHPHAQLQVSDSQLIANIEANNILFSSAVARTETDILVDAAVADIAGILLGMPFLSALAHAPDPTAQVISISADEISGFRVLHSTVSDKGRAQTFYTYFLLEKELVTFLVNARVTYEFDPVNGWLAQDVSFVTAVQNVDIEGARWIGRHARPFGHEWWQLIVEITAVENDGVIRANVYSFTPDYSHTAIGVFDPRNLTIHLRFDNWIVEPARFRIISDINLYGFLSVDDSSIRRVLRHNYNQFELVLSE